MPVGVSPTTVFTSADTELSYIEQRAPQLGVDPFVALAVIPHEGGLPGKTGDQGTSFGPWQLHVGGELPPNIKDPANWANSAAGIDYALGRIGKVTAGRQGTNAIEALVRGFERPADPAKEIDATTQTYFRLEAYGQSADQIDIAEFNKAAYGTGKVTNRSASDAGSYDITDAASGAANLVGKALSPLQAIGNLIGWITNGENWYRIGFFVLGIGLVGFGAYKALT